jgi:hypothetical protein
MALPEIECFVVGVGTTRLHLGMGDSAERGVFVSSAWDSGVARGDRNFFQLQKYPSPLPYRSSSLKGQWRLFWKNER